ncbi:MAG: c-type cytochrome domain-containing protein, partial [Limisphaerales bacterium]
MRKGGESGAAIVPGDVEKSLLIKAVRYTDKDLQMPPEKAGGKLSVAQIADLEAWVKMGAPD